MATNPPHGPCWRPQPEHPALQYNAASSAAGASQESPTTPAGFQPLQAPSSRSFHSGGSPRSPAVGRPSAFEALLAIAAAEAAHGGGAVGSSGCSSGTAAAAAGGWPAGELGRLQGCLASRLGTLPVSSAAPSRLKIRLPANTMWHAFQPPNTA